MKMTKYSIVLSKVPTHKRGISDMFYLAGGGISNFFSLVIRRRGSADGAIAGSAETAYSGHSTYLLKEYHILLFYFRFIFIYDIHLPSCVAGAWDVSAVPFCALCNVKYVCMAPHPVTGPNQ